MDTMAIDRTARWDMALVDVQHSTSRNGSTIGPAEQLRICLLGQFSVSTGARTVDEGGWYLRKAKSLVKLLSLAPDHRLHRGQIIDVLWPELDPEAGTNNLHKVLHIARRAL